MKKTRLILIITYVCTMVFFAGCGRGQEPSDDGVTYFHHSAAEERKANAATQADTQDSVPEEKQEYYLVTQIDPTEETLNLYRYANGMEYRYYYGTATRFYNKYGNRIPVSDFQQGDLVTIGDVNDEGILCEAKISDQAWVYEGIKRFSVNPDLNMLKIADTKYRYDVNTFVFSGEDRKAMTDIADGDILTVVGIDKRILSVNITTSQGILQLRNTELFEGSYIQIGRKIFSEITPDMTMNIPEGTYQLSVAKDGWGGNTEITVKRGETTTVDLNTLKGKGPKYGKIQFVIDTKDAVLLIDGKRTKYKKPVKLSYGNHLIEVYSDEYDVWKRNLVVNSKEATIAISLKDEQEKSSEKESVSTSDGTKNQTGSQSNNQSSSQSSSQSNSQSEKEKRQEELDMIKDLVSGLTSTSSSVLK